MMRSTKYTLPFGLLLAIASSGLAQQESLPRLIRQIKPAVVAIITYDDKGAKLAQGSGFFIRPNRLITNRHVIEDASSAEIRTFSGKTYRIQGITALDDEGDLVMLQVSIPPTNRISPLQITKIKPEEGERIFVIGNPLGLEGTISDGLVSSVREIAGFGTLIQITAPISPGSSGSPVINLRGQVVGVATSQLSRGQNLNFAMPSSRIAAMRASHGKTLAEFVSETASKHLAQAMRFVLQGRARILAAWKKQPDGSIRWDHEEETRAIEEAIPLFTQAIQIAPDHADAWRALVDAYSVLDRYSETVEAYEHAMRLNAMADHVRYLHSFEFVLYRVAIAYDNLNRYEAAINLYQEIIRLSPSEISSFLASDAALRMGHIYEKQERYLDAIKSYQQAITLQPDSYLAYGALASVYLFNLSDSRAAVQACLRAISIKPDYDSGHYILGFAYLSSGNRGAALEEHKILKPLNTKLADSLFDAIYKK